MARAHSPRIVMDGLVFCVDAANKKSYPGSGTTWTDLIGGNTGTIDGATFSGSEMGIFDLDGVNDHVDFSTSSDFAFGTGDYTISYWINFDSVNSTETMLDLRNSYSGSSNDGYADYYQDSSGIKYKTWSNVSSTYYTSTASFSTGIWYNVTALRDDGTFKLYINGSLDGSTSNSNNFPGTKCTFGWNVSNNSGRSIDGQTSLLLIYKGKALTGEEVKQNYNAFRTRYGL